VQSGHRGEGPESGIKFSPMSNPVQRDETCHFITDLTKDKDAVQPRFATMCNTFPDTVVLLPDGRPAITITYGGMGGPAMKPIALGHISQFRKNQQEGNLPDYIEFVGSGGAETGQDVLDYTRVGASLVQATTPAADNGDDPGVYGEIAAQYAGLLENQED
jgi:dihydroorotate dehydrogenase